MTNAARRPATIIPAARDWPWRQTPSPRDGMDRSMRGLSTEARQRAGLFFKGCEIRGLGRGDRRAGGFELAGMGVWEDGRMGSEPRAGRAPLHRFAVPLPIRKSGWGGDWGLCLLPAPQAWGGGPRSGGGVSVCETADEGRTLIMVRLGPQAPGNLARYRQGFPLHRFAVPLPIAKRRQGGDFVEELIEQGRLTEDARGPRSPHP